MKQKEESTVLLALYKLVAMGYVQKLAEPIGEVARDYFASRGLSAETIRKFGLGYAPYGKGDWFSLLKSMGYSDATLQASNLFVSTEDGMKHKFYNRVMFPIMDEDGRVIAFGGRVLDDRKPKYINSNDSEIYHKSEHLYAFQIAKHTAAKELILSEGYMDTITLHQAGFDNAVASLGTSLTKEQVQLMKTHGFQHVVISYDSDEAGKRAALRAIPMLESEGISVSVLSTEPYKDPDELIKAEGHQGYQAAIDRAISGFEFEVQQMAAEYDTDVPEEASSLYKKLAEKIVTLPKEQQPAWKTKVAAEYPLSKAEWQTLFTRAEHDIFQLEKEFKKTRQKNALEL